MTLKSVNLGHFWSTEVNMMWSVYKRRYTKEFFWVHSAISDSVLSRHVLENFPMCPFIQVI